jgi:hypothetical protein
MERLWGLITNTNEIFDVGKLIENAINQIVDKMELEK